MRGWITSFLRRTGARATRGGDSGSTNSLPHAVQAKDRSGMSGPFVSRRCLPMREIVGIILRGFHQTEPQSN
jgi:hypothetical protein